MKKKIADFIVGKMDNEMKQALFRKFEETYREHPDWEKMKEEMKKRLKLA